MSGTRLILGTISLALCGLIPAAAAAQECGSAAFKAACDERKKAHSTQKRICYNGVRLPKFSVRRSGEVSRTQHLVYVKSVMPGWKVFADKWGKCFKKDASPRGCAIDRYVLTDCYLQRVKRFDKALAADLKKLLDRHAKDMAGAEEKAKKKQWELARNYIGGVLNRAEFHLSHKPDHAKLKEIVAAARARDLEYARGEAVALKKVRCLRGKNRNKKLEKALSRVLAAWFGDMGIQEKVRVLRMNGKATKKTDALGRKWEFIETVGCIERTASHLKGDPTRCRIYTTTFKRVKAGGRWSAWSWDGFLGNKPKILCKKVK